MCYSNTYKTLVQVNPKKYIHKYDCTQPYVNIMVDDKDGVQLKGIYPEFQVIRGFSQKIPAGLLSYDQIHS